MSTKTIIDNDSKLKCGIIMPISSADGCTEQHWLDVKNIIIEATNHAGFAAELVSESDDVGIIQKRIIQNIYDNPVVVCDISCKNANVMFELGMRLAFDRPAIIIKDDKTTYSFDTSPIEHIEYPRDLRYSKIIDFKDKLANKIKGTFEKATGDPTFTTFLKHFGEFKVAKIDTKVVSKEEYILDEIRDLKRLIYSIERQTKGSSKVSTDSVFSIESSIKTACRECLRDLAMHDDKIVEYSDNELMEKLMEEPIVLDIAKKYMVPKFHLSRIVSDFLSNVAINREISKEDKTENNETQG